MAALAVSCVKENGSGSYNPGETHDGVPVEFRASSEETVKSYVGDASGQILFNGSDKICVNGAKSYGETVSEDGTRISFTVDDVQGPYCAISPYTAAYQEKDGTVKYDPESKTMTVIVSGTGSPQGHVLNSTVPTYSPKAGIMAAYSENDTDMKFRHLMTYLKITIEGGEDTDDISHIYVRRNSGENPNIAGSYKVDFSADPIGFTPLNQTSIIMYNCNGNAGVPQGTPVMIGIPAVDYDEGLIITVKDVNGHFQSYGISNAKYASKRGYVINKTVAFSPKNGQIRNADDWNAFAAFANKAPQNDWELYRWIGTGTGIVEIANDFEVEEGETLEQINKLEYTIDGKGHTITMKNAGNESVKPLAGQLAGKICNLTLAGEMTLENKNYISVFADTMLEGASMENCINRMNITVNDGPNYMIFGGLVRLIEGGSMKDCVNEGDLTANIDFSANDKNLQVGGIAAQTLKEAAGEIVLDGCINRGKITVNPVGAGAHGLNYNSVGGIIAWLRHENASLVLRGCVNEGDIEYMGTGIGDYAKESMCCVGGIIGTGCACNATSLTADGTSMRTLLDKCRNTGTIYNCFSNYSKGGESDTKVYTGGIAGSLMGSASDYAQIKECESYGDIIPYDICGEDSSSRPAYCQVTGGLIGFGGYVNISDTKVNCKIGNGKRPTAAYGGVIGFTMKPFTMTGSTIYTIGYWQRISAYTSNRAMCFCVPAKYGSTAMSPAPDISGSSISRCTIGIAMNTSVTALSSDDRSDLSGTLKTTPTWNTAGNCVSGQGYGALTNDVTFTGVEYTGRTNPF